jgi:hypothetical protein
VKAKSGKDYAIPDELDEAHIILKTGWTIWEVRNTPTHIIEELKLLWRAEYLSHKTARQKAEQMDKAK